MVSEKKRYASIEVKIRRKKLIGDKIIKVVLDKAWTKNILFNVNNAPINVICIHWVRVNDTQ